MKWILFLIIVAAIVLWLRNGKRGRLEHPEMKTIEQSRFYVSPPKEEQRPADDHQNDRY